MKNIFYTWKKNKKQKKNPRKTFGIVKFSGFGGNCRDLRNGKQKLRNVKLIN